MKNRLSAPITALKNHYDVVVIGSGYGGSIAASRMARLGKQVCLLEKGREFLPGEFPAGLSAATKEMQLSKGKLHVGPKDGLYEFVVGDDISVFKGCGLGGTSLVNANVSIEAEERVFDDRRWPKEIREHPETLKAGIERARQMLQPNPYPEGRDNYPLLNKTEALRRSAKHMDKPFRLMDINVRFEDGPNYAGVEQKKCNNCGDCVTGCNAGAKNTTHMNYLPDAAAHGARIFTEVSVSHLERRGNRWLVWFDLPRSGRNRFKAPLLFITADSVILGAGSLGSTEILIRSAERGLELSNVLGKRFTGNGDVLGFGYNNDTAINGIGQGSRIKAGVTGKVGPCITSAIDLRRQPNLEEGMTLEEGTVPYPIRSILAAALIPLARVVGRDTDRDAFDYLREKWRELKSFSAGPFLGAMNNTQIYLVMTHDDGNGELELKDNKINIRWPGVGEQEIFKSVNRRLIDATTALGGNFVRSPAWTKLMNYDLITVHPLGGCIMADDAAEGVVNHRGQVFAGKSGTEVYPGLYVMDGAVIPRTLGTNPLLTISGLAERNCLLIAEEKGQRLSYTPAAAIPEGEPDTTGIRFTETMRGSFRKTGAEDDQPFEFTLTILAPDISGFIADENHEAGMAGSVTAPSLSASPMTVSRGVFNLFVRDPARKDVKLMKYAMQLHSAEGRTYYFKGYKEIENNSGFDVWKDTTVLFITLYDGADDRQPVLGQGQLKILPFDFLKQIATITAIRPRNRLNAIWTLIRFGLLFGGNIFKTYFRFRKSRNVAAEDEDM